MQILPLPRGDLTMREMPSLEEKAPGEEVGGDSRAPSPARLESFSDGVIAVIITVMVLNLRLPIHDGLMGLREILPAGAIYLLSFSFTGIYWLNHQQMTRRLHAAGYALQICNLAFLFCLSLLPFSTYYLISRHIGVYSVQQYATTLFLIGASFYLVRVTVHRHLSLYEELTRRDNRTRLKHGFSIALYLLCIPLASHLPKLALGLLAIDTTVWAVPGLSLHVLWRPR
jgi:uncharacterized membrane protein